MTPRSRRIGRTVVAVLLAPVIALVVAAVLTPLPAELSEARYSESVRFTDRDGAMLREVRADDATRARWIDLSEVGEVPEKALLAAEDARFYEHPGVDPIAVLRAAISNVAHLRVVSGASTVSMQVARLVRPHKRNLWGKLGEMALALRIEASLSKKEVLEQYTNRAPFGAQVRGFSTASWFYFDKPPRELSLAEAATLAAIPRGPYVYSLTKHPERVIRRRDRILGRMLASRWISKDERDRAVAEPLNLHLSPGSFGAPHLIQALYDGSLGPGIARGAPLRGSAQRGKHRDVTTTIAKDLQREAETATLLALRPLAKRHVTAASVVVLDNASGDVLAYVGSPDFFDKVHGGQNDGVRARRQPGSTLKPFVYGLAMERLNFTAATVLPDVELRLAVPGGVYAPRDYDERFHGPVRLREALANSLNVPAVWTAWHVGEGPLLDRLHEVGFASLTESPEYYGPALALGDGEVTLLELADAYATIARGGLARKVRMLKAAPDASVPERRVMPAAVAAVLTDILADKGARLASFGERSALELPFDAAVKTGTSKGYRDNWTVGFTREVTVAVWVGNFDGSAMQGVSGITGAAPLFRAVMEAAMRRRPQADESRADVRLTANVAGPELALVEVEVCPLSGLAPGPACAHTVHEWLPHDHASPARCDMHERTRIDRRNGLLAGSGCAARDVEVRTFERFDGPLAAWAHGAHREIAPAAWSPLCPPGDHDAARAGDPPSGVSAARYLRASARLRIGYPHDGARFLIDPERPRAHQTLAVRVEAPAGAARVALRVDGRPSGSASSPYVMRWMLAPGEHVIVAEAEGLPDSESVHISVD